MPCEPPAPLCRERRLTASSRYRMAAETVGVRMGARLRVRLGNQFGGEITETGRVNVVRGKRRREQADRRAEVDNSRNAIGCQQHIARLQVPVNEPLPVDVTDDLRQLLDEPQGLLNGIGRGELSVQTPVSNEFSARYGTSSHQPALDGDDMRMARAPQITTPLQSCLPLVAASVPAR